MSDTENFVPVKDWRPCQLFYLSSMHTVCESASRSYHFVSSVMSEDSPEVNMNAFLDELQNIVQQGAMLSRYFWPSAVRDPLKNAIHQQRGEFLRKAFNVSDDSPLKNRRLRNLIEHFDEYLDVYLSQTVAGRIVPEFVGHEPERSVPIHFFRAYFTELGIFEILGNRFELVPVVEEIEQVFQLLLQHLDRGYFVLDGALDDEQKV